MIISSIISNPTLYVGLFEYGSNTIRDLGTSTNDPLKKYTPLSTPKDDPVAVASSATKVNTVSPDFNVVFP